MAFSDDMEDVTILDFHALDEVDWLNETDIYLLILMHLMIICNVLDTNIFGSQFVKILKLVTNNLHTYSDILCQLGCDKQ